MCADDTVGKPFVAQLSLSLKWCPGQVADTHSPNCVLGMLPWWSLRDPLVNKSFNSSFQWRPRDQLCKLTSESVIKFIGSINIHEMSLILFDYVNRYGMHYQLITLVFSMFVCFVKTFKQLRNGIRSEFIQSALSIAWSWGTGFPFLCWFRLSPSLKCEDLSRPLACSSGILSIPSGPIK